MKDSSQGKPGPLGPRTRFEADVAEVLGGRHAASIGSTVAVLRYGGTRQVDGRSSEIEVVGFPAWNVGRTLLVLLRWAEPDQTYVLPFGPDGAFERHPATDKVETSAHSALGIRQKGRSFADLLREIKAAVR